MIRLLTVLFILILSQSVSNAQEKSKSKKVSRHKQTRNIMREQIRQLKNGVLLVRLQTKENSINALKKIGKYELADEINKKQVNYNKRIISAFKTNFTFCPIYFFYSSYSDSILSKQINGVVFLNDNLQLDSTIKLSKEIFLTAEFGIIEQDTAKYYSDFYYFPGENGPEKRKTYYGSPDMKFGVLKIMSDQLVQLRKPFPYYVRTFDSLPIKRKPSKAVLRMNKKLLSFYEKNISK